MNQFYYPNTWDEISVDKRLDELFKDFPELPHVTFQEVKDSLQVIQKRYEETLCAHDVLIEHYTGPSALFFWVADDRTGVFAINAENGHEQTFATSDGNLTDSFSSFFESQWRDNKERLVQCRPERQRADAGSVSPER